VSSHSIVDPLISHITSEIVEKYVPFALWTYVLFCNEHNNFILETQQCHTDEYVNQMSESAIPFILSRITVSTTLDQTEYGLGGVQA